MDKVLGSISGGGGDGGGGAAPGAEQRVPPACIRSQRDKYYVLDVRGEDDEIEEAKASLGDLTVDERLPLGKLLRLAAEGKMEHLRTSGKKVVTLCNVGYRAGVAARELAAKGFDAAAMERGMLAYNNGAAVRPDFVVVLGTSDSAENVTLALTAAAAKASQGKQVVLVAMSAGVETLRNPGVPPHPSADADADARSLRVADVDLGAPYKPAGKQLDKFLAAGGVVLGCKSCIVHRGFKYGETLHPCVQPMQMPDLLRMLEEASSNLQFM